MEASFKIYFTFRPTGFLNELSKEWSRRGYVLETAPDEGNGVGVCSGLCGANALTGWLGNFGSSSHVQRTFVLGGLF